MDPDRLKKYAADTRRTRAELEQMLHNCISKGDKVSADVVTAALDEKFPQWNSTNRMRGGKRPAAVRFDVQKKSFATSKEAYIWLVEQFIGARPQLFATEGWERQFVTEGRGRNYFARDIQALFRATPHLADDPNNYVRLSNGWYANTNLDNARKSKNLDRLAAICKLNEGNAWSWDVLDPSDDLLEHEDRKKRGRQFIEEIRKKIGNK